MNKLYVLLICFLICDIAHAQNIVDFSEDAFLIDNKKEIIIYKDSFSNKIASRVKNIPDSDKYYLFQLLQVSGNRIKITTRYTIDAEQNDTLTLKGWINYGQIGIYGDFTRQKPFAYSSCNEKSKKIFFNPELNFKPFEIRKINFINHQIWMQVIIHGESNTVHYGWFSPALQCMDIWNACVHN